MFIHTAAIDSGNRREEQTYRLKKTDMNQIFRQYVEFFQTVGKKKENRYGIAFQMTSLPEVAGFHSLALK